MSDTLCCFDCVHDMCGKSTIIIERYYFRWLQLERSIAMTAVNIRAVASRNRYAISSAVISAEIRELKMMSRSQARGRTLL